MSKSFSSQSLNHLKQYPVVQKAIAYAFSFHLVNVVYTYAFAVANLVYSKLVAYIPVTAGILQKADTKFDVIVLSSVDAVVGKSENLVKHGDTVLREYRKKGGEYVSAYKLVGDDYKKKAADIAGAYKKKGGDTISLYLKPVNEYASSTVDKVLPKVKEAGESTATEASNELYKSIEIVNDTLTRSKHLISSKSNDISNSVISTYNQQFDAAAAENYYAKVASASINTGVSLLKTVNLDYIQPIKDTTQTYAQDAAAPVKKKAQEISEAVAEASNGVAAKLSDEVPVVTASA